MSIIIGITGPTGGGKSSLFSVAQDLGYKVIDCDKTARKATERGTEGLKAVVLAFGEDILNPDGSLNRRTLAQKAFKSTEKTELLNATLLPHIVKLVTAECKDGKTVLDAPTLFESGLDSECDVTVGVLADREIRLKRIMERDGIDEASALLRINAGKPDSFYKEKADFILCNNGDINEFRAEFSAILKDIKER